MSNVNRGKYPVSFENPGQSRGEFLLHCIVTEVSVEESLKIWKNLGQRGGLKPAKFLFRFLFVKK